MLESHNDTAVAIAEHIGGSVENFAKLMNEKAKLLGCRNTNFVTPNGLDQKEHYTTAAELCAIASYAIENKTFLKIIKTASHAFKDCTGKKRYQARSHNLFLSSYAGAFGIKTGFTGNAGYCFCGAAKRNGTTLVSTVLASGFPPHKTYKWTDTKKLMDYGLRQVNERQNINGLDIFPTEYFCPMNQYTGKIAITPNTYSIHHYSATWMTPADQERRKLREKYSYLGLTGSNIVSSFIAYRRHYGIIGMWGNIFRKLIKTSSI